MNLRQHAYGIAEKFYENLPVTPERFYRGSTVLTTTLSHVEWVGGPVRVSSGFPTVREPHRPEGNRGIEAFGNDKLLEAWE